MIHTIDYRIAANSDTLVFQYVHIVFDDVRLHSEGQTPHMSRARSIDNDIILQCDQDNVTLNGGGLIFDRELDILTCAIQLCNKQPQLHNQGVLVITIRELNFDINYYHPKVLFGAMIQYLQERFDVKPPNFKYLFNKNRHEYDIYINDVLWECA